MDPLEAMPADATHLDLFFTPCAPPVLAWDAAAPAIRRLLALGFPGAPRPLVERFTTYRAGDAVMTQSPSADEAPRVVRVTTLFEADTSAFNAGGSPHSLVRAQEVRALSAHEFPSSRAYDAISRVTRARWTLHHRVRLHADFEDDWATVYIRYTRATRDNVDIGAVRTAIERASAAVGAALK